MWRSSSNKVVVYKELVECLAREKREIVHGVFERVIH